MSQHDARKNQPISPQDAKGSVVETTDGLSEAEARTRLARYGPNEIQEEPSGLLRGILKRFWGPIPWMLEVALLLEVSLGKTTEPALIAGLLLFSAVLGGSQERRANASLDLLRRRLRVNARVRRDGKWRQLPARDLVPGDQVRVGVGDLVPADCIIIDGTVEVDQAALTGESAAVSRSKHETIYSGSTVHRGEATATVAATGAHTYFGRTAELVRTAGSVGHLEQLLYTVVRYLVAIDAVLAAVLIAGALWRGEELLPLAPVLLVLVTATLPVTMPAAFTVSNAVEARSLAKEGVLVTGLTSIQEAATMDILCVDKTGTLTQNQEKIVGIVPLSKESADVILALAAAACDPASQSPLELAVFQAMRQRSLPPFNRLGFAPFDPAKKRSEAIIAQRGRSVRVVLGSPIVVEQLAETKPEFTARVKELAATGARVLAVAAGLENRLIVRGLVALADTPRDDAATLIKALQALGIRVIMVTGDTLATAQAVSLQVGLGHRFGDVKQALNEPLQYDGFANCYPEDKFRLVQALQRFGRVGMTGDGINDAPALKQADVGIAVNTATDVAKAAAKVVLTRPGLHDIVEVVSGGRRVYRRMLTWTITKIARTVELAALLTFGYLATGIFVTPLFLIVLIIVMNDLVTITVATDRAWVSPVPERWNVREIAKVAGVFAMGWLILAFALLWAALNLWELPIPQVQTLMFVYLIYSAQATIYLSRVRDRVWSLAPSAFVAATTLGNVLVASVLAYWGVLMAAVPAALLLGTLGLVLAAALMLNEVKIWLFRSSGILGSPKQVAPGSPA
jgi:H+-transporting ATPase